MAAAKQQSQNAITLKGSSKLVMDYLSEWLGLGIPNVIISVSLSFSTLYIFSMNLIFKNRLF